MSLKLKLVIEICRKNGQGIYEVASLCRELVDLNWRMDVEP